MKKLAFLMAVVLLFSMALIGCNNETSSQAPQDSSTPSSQGGDNPGTDPNDPYAHLDLSKEEKVVMYASATEPNAIKEVMEKVNEKVKEGVNATIELFFIPSAERATKYPLVMAGGDVVDLIYTANWCYYKEQVDKAGFKELTEDFLKEYMPQTWDTLPESAWLETHLNGKVYMVPRSTAAIFPDRGPTINMEIARKYGFDTEDFTSFEAFDAFLKAVGDKEAANGMYAFYASASSTLLQIAMTYRFNLLNNQASDHMYYNQIKDPKFEDPFYLYTSEYYKAYVDSCKEYAAAGVWPTDAISNTNSVATLFSNKQSASTTNNYYNGITNIENYRSKGIDAELFYIFPEGFKALRDSFIGDGMAIPTFSKIPERAAVTLDFIKNDFDTYMLLAGGIEGRHYIYDAATNTIKNGPEAGDYVFDGWAWGIRHKDFPWPATDDKLINDANKKLSDNQVKDEEWPYWGFNFDYTPVSAEWAVISSLYTEYSTSFSLGQFGDKTDEEYAGYVKKLQDGGLEKYIAEWKKQREDFLANK